MKEECQKELLGTGRYGCRCQKCIEYAACESEYQADIREDR